MISGKPVKVFSAQLTFGESVNVNKPFHWSIPRLFFVDSWMSGRIWKWQNTHTCEWREKKTPKSLQQLVR